MGALLRFVALGLQIRDHSIDKARGIVDARGYLWFVRYIGRVAVGEESVVLFLAQDDRRVLLNARTSVSRRRVSPH